MTKAKIEAIAHITRAVSGLELAIENLQMVFSRATFSEQGMLLEQITALGERLDVNRIFLAHLKTTEVTVTKANRDDFARLDRALARLQKLEVEGESVSRVLSVAKALASSVGQTRKNVSRRAT